MRRASDQNGSRWLLAAGAAGAAVLTIGWLVAGTLQDGADVRRGAISDLGAANADRAWLWNVPLTVAGVLIAIFALGLYRVLRPSFTAGLGAGLIAIAGIGLALEGAVFQLDCRETEPHCEGRPSYSWQHSAHELETALGFLALLVAIVLLALRFRREPDLRILWRYSLLSAAAFVFLLLLSGLAEESDWEGIVQRLLVTVLLAWIAVVGIRLARPAWKVLPPRRRITEGDV